MILTFRRLYTDRDITVNILFYFCELIRVNPTHARFVSSESPLVTNNRAVERKNANTFHYLMNANKNFKH